MATVREIHEVECPFCHAGPGQHCTHQSGFWSGQPCSSFHNERARVANERNARWLRDGRLREGDRK